MRSSNAQSQGKGPAARPPVPFSNRVQDLVAAAWRPTLFLVVLCFVWWLVTYMAWVKPYLIPSPGKVWQTVMDNGPMLWKHTGITSYETVVGFVLAVLIGELAAVGIVFFPSVEKTIYPILLFAQVIPKIAIAPLFVIWLGFGLAPKIVSAVLIAFFPVVISGVTGLRSVDPELLDLSATMGAGVWKTFFKIRLPASLPHLFSGLKVAATLAVVGAVVGEFVGANSGLGYLLLIANGNLDAALLFAGLIIMSLVGIVLFGVIEVAEKLLLPWHASRRSHASSSISM